MERETIVSLTETFEANAQQMENGIEYWLARDLQFLLGYEKWDNFLNVVNKAKTACELSGHLARDHFADVGKTIKMPKGAEKEIQDFMLTRYACYLIAQNGDPKKEQIAFAQTYFAVQTRKAELIEQRLLEAERVRARHKLSATEKELSAVIFEQTGDKQDFATEITIFNTHEHDMKSESAISQEHVTNNQAVRNTLLERGIRPESLPAAEDVKKVERQLASDEKKSLKNAGSLSGEE